MNNTISFTPIRRFFNLLKVDRQEIISIYIYALFNGVVALSLPLGIQAIINLISGGQVSTSWILLVAFVIAGVAVTGILQIMQLTISENLQQKILTRAAFEFAYRIPRMKLEAIDKYYVPELVNRFFDTLSVQKGLSKILLDFSSASLQVIFGLILLSLYHPFFILFSFILVVIVYLIFQFTAPRGLRTSLVESKYKYEVAHWLEELARTMETFKLAGNSPLPMNRTDETVEGYLVARKAHFRTLLVQYINLVGFKVIIAAGLLLIGGLLVINQQMNIGQFVASEIIIILVLASVEKLILSMETIYDVLTALEKIGSVTDIPLEKDLDSNIKNTGSGALGIKLKDLSFRFDDAREDLLSNINLEIGKGEKLCLSGFDGSGKSVLLNIIAGLYEDFSGSITVNGISVKNWNKSDLHDRVNDNLAREDIFRGTLLENITLGKPDITPDQLQKIADVVGLSDYIDTLPDGYETLLLPEGKHLPRSVILKIKLSRSLIGNPGLILFENNFSQLNASIKQRFLDYLLGLNATVIAISNDPEVCKAFDRVAVLEKGRIIANDSLSNLKNYPWYTSIFQKK